MFWGGDLAAPRLAVKRPCRPGLATTDSWAFLIRDAAVQAELQLTASQRQKVTELMDEVAGQLWKLRLLPPEQAGPQSRPLAKKVQTTLRRILSDPQQARLKQIALQSRWPHALLEPAVVSRLDITADQRRRLAEIIERPQRDLDELRQQGPPSAALAAARRDIEVRRDEEIAGVLTAEQQKRWPSLAGKPFDLSRIGFMRAPAPELIEGEWINS